MRNPLVVLAIAAAPALAAAQGNPAVGPCAGAGPLDSATKASIVAKPDRQPRRQDDGIRPHAENTKMQTLESADDDRNLEGPQKWVVAFGIVDTTGHIDPRTAEIKQSSSIVLSHAVCDVLDKMTFAPALLHGQKVPAPYQERFVFRSSVTNVDLNHGGDRH